MLIALLLSGLRAADERCSKQAWARLSRSLPAVIAGECEARAALLPALLRPGRLLLQVAAQGALLLPLQPLLLLRSA